MALNKIIPPAGAGVVGLPDTPGLSTREMQEKFDELALDYIIPAFNETVELLETLGLDQKVAGENISAMRLLEEEKLEVLTPDGWKATSSSGHVVLDGEENKLPQRKVLKFEGATVIDQGDMTVVTGLRGPEGPVGPQGIPGLDGNSFQVLGMYGDVAALEQAHGVGSAGDAYAVGEQSDNEIYIWDVDKSRWENIGALQGPAGPQGVPGADGPQGPPTTVNGISGENIVLTREDIGTVGEKAANSQNGEVFNDYVNNIATGLYAHAEGFKARATANYAHAEGSDNRAEGYASHVEGYQNLTQGDYSHAEGCGTKATHQSAHAEGDQTVASGFDAHAEGYMCKALGDDSHAGGHKTIAEGEAQTAIGRFNVADTTSAFMVGIGTAENARKNAITVGFDGATKVLDDENYDESKVRNISAGTADLVAGVTELANGAIYFVYEQEA